ncbi:hypothetical protein G7Z12_37685 [Streptomyces sp. ID38640]|uniref:SbcC/MukB-like Walker B domain-containing protein n=1 Tax=Streptomyces sp. ID38640 TaxID=1265399 RepID=UPI00140F2983|nr:SbcC/MukB-like Walker B domain-containing protein [Streptomyces sp. ID38640]QIK04714.1 hypothetical protein G7Z12_00055 [Streptomyces sp. ID38640]QIK10879.1 hypothetical protein G7Z12_37350 [Streptomyces sp. ID38640]QIK10932.1 hypothetical protein G7Z12_37685 [Streptomyces sp. ID38640]
MRPTTTSIAPPSQHLSQAAADAHALGTPGTDGRWQPTKAGVVNSWAWASEQLWFADGWLALVGPNGSGKSLTASMLITTLLDADTSQTALSVSGKAAGTLTSRHTDRNDKEDRTGVWWLEYGLRDPSDDSCHYLTTGLWLRATGGHLHRAFFLAPGRVGDELTLETDRTPVRLDALAGQLAACQGEVFTDSKALGSSLAQLSPQRERSYRQAVRTRLFAPLNEVQFEALLAVLRSLRSLRTAEAISPSRMCQVLTDALPALDPDNLSRIAEEMERIAELERKLERTRAEATLLKGTDRTYRRYLRTVAQAEAASLAAANTEFDNLARRTREAAEQLKSAQAASRDASAQHTRAQTEISRLSGRLSADEALLRKHAGADLPHREKRARDLADAAHDAEGRAEAARTDAEKAAERAETSLSYARAAQEQLTRIAGDLETRVTGLDAQAAFENLFASSQVLAAARTSSGQPMDTQRLCGPPLAWAEDRLHQLQRVDRALSTHEHALKTQRAAVDERRNAEDTEDDRRSAARQATEQRRLAEVELNSCLQTWQDGASFLGPLPPQLAQPADVHDGADRVDTVRLAAWLKSAADAARTRIDLAGHRQAAATAAARAEAATVRADEADREHALAEDAVSEAADAHQTAADQAHAEAETDEHRRTEACRTHEQAHHDAQAALEVAGQDLADAERAALDAARAWIGDVHAWRADLHHLAATDIPLPDESTPAAELSALDPAALALAAFSAHGRALPQLQRRADAASRRMNAAQEQVALLEGELEESRRAAPTPPPPAWRTRTPQDGAAPLWSLVDFAPGLSADQADRLEGALWVAGLLDARVTADGLVCDGDLTLTPDGRVPGRTLADLLAVEDTRAVDADRVRAVLAAVSVDAPGSDLWEGRLAHGVLTASAPDGYQATFIGRTARERARRQRVARLEQDLSAAQQTLADAREQLEQCHQATVEAAAERDSLPPATQLKENREHAARQRAATADQQRRTAEAQAAARLTLEQDLAALQAAAAKRTAHLDAAALTLQHAEQAQSRAAEQAAAAHGRAAEQTAIAEASEESRTQAAAAQQTADAERSAFPSYAVEAVEQLQEAEDAAEAELSLARRDVVASAQRHEAAGTAVGEALRTLNRAAALPGGGMLGTDPQHLETQQKAVSQLLEHIQAWKPAAARVNDLLDRSDEARQEAALRHQRRTRAEEEAEAVRWRAEEEASSVAEMRALYGAEYQELLARHETTAEQLQQARNEADTLRARQQAADTEAGSARGVLDTIDPLRQDAETKRDDRLRQLSHLADAGLATVPNDLPTDTAGRPAHLTAGLTWARRLLADAPAGTDRAAALIRQRDRDLNTLEIAARKASAGLASFDRQVTLQGIDDTPWRRALVADPAALRGEDVSTAVQDLNATAAQLEDDLRADVKQTLKASLFTRLQRDIQLRREAAQLLVSQIRRTLAGVRTGVAHVGVQVEWDVRDTPDAQRMVELIAQPPSDDTFEQMYDVLRQRMNDKAGEPWSERIAHTFDYRGWYGWKIYVTHRSFEAAGKERFREVLARSNPLDSLSTGEKRLATMLPLLAAAWSMYSAHGYAGPRLLSIDELDAAFDDPNLRQVLKLLRSWNFDVLATAPFMTPMIKRETQRAMIHQVVSSGRHRITVPWLWQGHGEPQLLTFDSVLATDQTQDTL